MTGVMAEQYDFTADSGDNTLYYKITDAASTPKTVEVVSELECRYPDYKSYTTAPTGALTIPDSVSNDGTTYSVTSIGEAAFYDCSSLTGSLSIPNSVTSIGESAFDNCSGFDGSLTIGNSVTSIGDCAFDNCSGFKGSLTIGNSVTSIGDWAFRDCSGFTGSLTIPNSVTRIRQEAFNDCSGFDGSLTIGNSVTSIGDGAFAECSALTSLTMLRPTPPTTVGSNAFQNAGFSTVNVPAGAKAAYDGGDGDGEWKGFTIVEAARYDFKADSGDNTLYYKITDADAKTVEVVSELDYWDDSKAYNTAPKGTLTIPESVSNDDGTEYSVTSIEEWAFYDCSSFTGSLTIGNSVTRIGDYAFRGCSGFTGSLTIGNSVTNIGESAFCECSGFTGSLTIPNSVTSIGAYAFYYCGGFTGSLTIGSSVTSIGEAAFAECSALTSLTMLRPTPPAVGIDVFDNTNLTTVNVPAGAKTAYAGGSNKWQGLTIAELNYSFTALSDGTTLYYKITDADAKTVAVVSELDYWAGMKSYNTAPTGTLTIPETVSNGGIDYTVTSIGEMAFNSCSGFAGALTIPNSVTSIWDDAFAGCTGFDGSLTIGNSVTSIGMYAFYGCSGFTGSLTIPNSVTSIGESAFSGCSSITAINVDVENPNYSSTDGILYNNDFTTLIQCPAGKTGTLTIPNSVTSIGDGAFYNCSNLTSLTMLRPTPPTVGSEAFNSVGFTEVNVPAGAKDAYDGEGEDADGLWQGLTIVDALEAAKAAKLAEVAALDDDLTEADYTAESWKAFQDAMTADKDAINGKETVADVEAYVLTAIAAKDALEEKVATSLDNATAAAPFTRIQNTLYFAQPTQMAVYNVSGVMLHSGEVMEYTLPNAAGVYIIRTANSCVKVMK